MSETTGKQIISSSGNAVGMPAKNYFTEYAEQAQQRTIIGKLLKFSKGDYFAGEDDDEVPFGTRFIVNMDNLLIGWIRWQDNKPTDVVMGRVAAGYQPAKRSELGDDDESKWSRDPSSNELRDPWQYSNYLLLKRVAANNTPLPASDEENAHIYTFTTSSKGGLGSVFALAKKYGALMRRHEHEWPVIEIGGDSYPHKNKAFGRIKFPVLKLVGWVPKDRFTLNDDVSDVDEEEPTLPLDKPAAGARL